MATILRLNAVRQPYYAQMISSRFRSTRFGFSAASPDEAVEQAVAHAIEKGFLRAVLVYEGSAQQAGLSDKPFAVMLEADLAKRLAGSEAC